MNIDGRAWSVKRFISRSASGIESLAIEELAAPGPIGPGQVRVAMRAASINYRDLLYVSGTFGPAGAQGLVPCSDGAGEIIEVAGDVARFKVGDRVALTFDPNWIGGPFPTLVGGYGRGSVSIPGVMREQIVIHHSEAVALPQHLSFEEGAAYPCAGVTAWNSLTGSAPLQPGMSVLLQGGGGVSVLALQFAKLFGARVIMISSSAERCTRLKTLGADETVDYRADPEWHKAVRRLTDGMGVDLTVEIGGAQTMERSIAATRSGGRVAVVGLLTGWAHSVAGLQKSGVDLIPIKVGPRTDFEALFRAVAFHRQRPVIGARYAFEQLPAALRELQTARHIGKIVIGF
jgi:NADPH:quinone reductase-like Zn-dependent oxidoreductase